jgi:hypothetical protein
MGGSAVNAGDSAFGAMGGTIVGETTIGAMGGTAKGGIIKTGFFKYSVVAGSRPAPHCVICRIGGWGKGGELVPPGKICEWRLSKGAGMHPPRRES